MSHTRQIYCCGCASMVEARLTNGKEIYAHRPDLWGKPFWLCDSCGGYVGCHNNHPKKSKRFNPIGTIPTPQIRQLRNQIHNLLDPLWQQHIFSRHSIYKKLAVVVGKTYHTAELSSVNDCHKIINYLVDLRQWAVKNRGFKA